MRIYLVHAHGMARDAVSSALAGDVVVLDDPLELNDLEEREPGPILLLGAEHDLEGLLGLATRVADAPPGWSLLLLRPEEGEVRALSLGPPLTLDEVGAFATDPNAGPGALFDLNGVLADIARVRHDVNNPLTSALAETQLLLLDAEDPELRESLDVIQEQLRRIRDLLASTGHLRPPRP